MGYFLDIHNSSNRAKDVAFINEQNGVKGSDSWKGELAVVGLTSIFQYTLSNIGNCVGDKESSATSSSTSTGVSAPDDTVDDAKKAQLEEQKAQLFAQLPEGAPQDSKEFNNYLNNQNDEIVRCQSEKEADEKTLKDTQDQISTLNNDIANLNTKKSELLNDLNIAQKNGSSAEDIQTINNEIQEIERQINDKNKEKQTCEGTIQNLTTNIIPKHEQDITKLRNNYNQAQPIMEQIVNIEKQIKNIDNGGVEEKAKSLKSFTEALKAWKNAPEGAERRALAQEVVDAFDKMGNKVSASTIQLYQLYDQDLNNDINGKREDIYKEKEAQARK